MKTSEEGREAHVEKIKIRYEIKNEINFAKLKNEKIITKTIKMIKQYPIHEKSKW